MQCVQGRRRETKRIGSVVRLGCLVVSFRVACSYWMGQVLLFALLLSNSLSVVGVMTELLASLTVSVLCHFTMLKSSLPIDLYTTIYGNHFSYLKNYDM
jgi:hypothetical protein